MALLLGDGVTSTPQILLPSSHRQLSAQQYGRASQAALVTNNRILLVGGPNSLRGRSYRSLAVRASSSSGSGDFQRLFSDLSGEAKRRVDNASRAVGGAVRDAFGRTRREYESFERRNRLKQKAREAVDYAGQKLEEFTFDLQKSAANFDREYKVSDRVQEFASAAGDQFQAVDDKFRVRYRVRSATADLRLRWPMYKRWIQEFQASSVGQFVIFCLFLWLVASGWIFQIFFWSFWLVPLLPLVLQSVVRSSVVQGSCPACGMQFVGPRGQTLVCQRCRGVVWKPQGRDGKRGPSSSESDNIRIIDVDPE